jgi:hypothetical protein
MVCWGISNQAKFERYAHDAGLCIDTRWAIDLVAKEYF